MTFLKRLFSTILLLTLLSIIVFCDKRIAEPLFYLAASAALFFGVRETLQMLERGGKKCCIDFCSVYAAIFPLLAYIVFHFCTKCRCFLAVNQLYFTFLMIFPWIALLFTEKKMEKVEQVLLSFGVLLMFLTPFSSVIVIFGQGQKLFFFLLLGTKIGDIAAYFFGTLSSKLPGGNHKIFPNLSPKKSWEGCISGLIVSMIFAWIAYPWCSGTTPCFCVSLLIGAVFYVFGAAGDLAESCLKRACNVKDSGRLFPGIGGMFDLIDSLMMNAVVFVFLRQIL